MMLASKLPVPTGSLGFFGFVYRLRSGLWLGRSGLSRVALSDVPNIALFKRSVNKFFYFLLRNVLQHAPFTCRHGVS